MEKQKMIDVLQFCAAQCTHCYDAPFRKKMDMSTVIMYNQDCADLCRLTAQLLERKSDNADIFFKTALVMCEGVRLSAKNIHKWSIAKMWKPVVNVQKCAMNMNGE
jgi:hypothetical protein